VAKPSGENIPLGGFVFQKAFANLGTVRFLAVKVSDISVVAGMPMSLLPRRSLKELVHEIVDVTPSLDLTDCPEANGYAIQVEAALSRSRANPSCEPSSVVNGDARAG
jgi:hypothetical protein